MSQSVSVEVDGDESLLTHLALGMDPSSAARACGVSSRTVYRRMRDPSFRSELDHAKEVVRGQVFAKLSDAANEAVGVLWGLMNSEDDSIRLKASKAILDSLVLVHGTLPRTITTVTETTTQ